MSDDTNAQAPAEADGEAVELYWAEVSYQGEALRIMREVAKLRGWTMEDLIAHLLVAAMPDAGTHIGGPAEWRPLRDPLVRVEPYVVNSGAGGFHVLTLVTDGYGNVLAEDDKGEELAAEAVSDFGDPTDRNSFTKAAIAVTKKVFGGEYDEETGLPLTVEQIAGRAYARAINTPPSREVLTAIGEALRTKGVVTTRTIEVGSGPSVEVPVAVAPQPHVANSKAYHDLCFRYGIDPTQDPGPQFIDNLEAVTFWEEYKALTPGQ